MAADTFTYFDGLLANVSGGAWSAPLLADFSVVSNRLRPAANAGYWESGVQFDTAPSSADQYAQVTTIINTSHASNQVALYLRYNFGTNSGYFVAAAPNYSATSLGWEITRLDAGVPTVLASGGTTYGTGTRTVRAEVIGTTIRVLVDGLQVGTTTDATYAGAGAWGIYCYTESGISAVEIDNWDADIIAAGPGAIPSPGTPPVCVGAGAISVDVTTGNPVTAAFPAVYTPVAGDLAILVAAGLHNNTTTLAPSDPAGYTQITTRFQNIATYDLQITAWRHVLAVGDTAPVVLVPAAYSTSAGGLLAYLLVFRYVDTTTPMDAVAVVSSGAAAATFTPTGITTATIYAMAVSLVASADDNALAVLAGSEQGFSIRAGGGAYDTTTGGDFAVGAATRQVDTAGAVTCPTWSETLVGNDAWAAITIALRPDMKARGDLLANNPARMRSANW